MTRFNIGVLILRLRPLEIPAMHPMIISCRCLRQIAVLLLIVAGSLAGARAQTANPQDGDDLFITKPQTPVRQVRGAVLAERLDRPDLAQGYIDDLLRSQPSTEALLELRHEFGIATFLRLASIQDLQPETSELLQLINEATSQETPSRSSVEFLIKDLGLSDQQTKEAALRIISAENVAVMPLMNAGTSTPQGRIADRLLHQYVRRFRFGLVAAVPDADALQKIRILNLLAKCADPQIAARLNRYCFSSSPEVADAANKAVSRLSSGKSQPKSAKDTARRLVRKSQALIKSIENRYPSISAKIEDRNLLRYFSDSVEEGLVFGPASLAQATMFARDAVAIAPDDPHCLAMLQVAEATQKSWPARWPDSLGVPVVPSEVAVPGEVDVLKMKQALESESSTAMLVLLQSDAAFAVFKHHKDVRRDYLLASDPRVRLLSAAIARACGETGMHIRASIKSVSHGNKLPEAVVIDSRSGESKTVAEALRTSLIDAAADMIRIQSGELASDPAIAAELEVTVDELVELRSDKTSEFSRHYATAATVTGRSGFVKATQQLNTELLLVHSNCLMWTLSGTIANLRSDYRTRAVPIIIYGPEGDHAATNVIRNQFDGVWFLTTPLSELTLADQMTLNGIPGPLLSVDERVRMIEFARGL